MADGTRCDVAVWAGVLTAAVCIALVGVALRGDSSLLTAANWAQIVSLAVALPSLVQVVRQSRRLAPALATSAGTAETVLADAVSVQWRAETVRRLLDDPDPMPVQWRITSHHDVMDHADNIMSGSLLTLSANSGDIAAVVAQFRALRRPRLVILGEGGTGKTTLAVQLVRELLATRTAKDPVPVLFTLTDWDPDTGKTLHDWIADRLRRDYPQLGRPELGKGVPRHLVSRGRVLPVLDGLDELPFRSRTALITQLNHSLSTTDQFILTSRTQEFTAAVRDSVDVLTSALVLEPEPLIGEEAARYLRRCLPPAALPMWADVLTALPATPALAETTSTALGLWLVREVYVTPLRDPASLLDFPDGQALRTHLFDHLIPALVTARPPDRDIAWWDLADGSGVLNAWFGAALAGILGMTTGVAGVLFFGGVWFGVAAVAVGAGAGIALWWTLREWAGDEPGYADLRVRGHYREFFIEMLQTLQNLLNYFGALRVSAGSLAILVVSAIPVVTLDTSPHATPDVPAMAFPWELVSTLAVVLAVVVAGLIVLVAALTLIRWSETPDASRSINSPQRSWRADRALTGVRAAVLGVAAAGVAGAVSGVATGMFTDWITALKVGSGIAAFAGIVGILVAVFLGNHHGWLAYLAATTMLAARGQLPHGLLAFLDDAQRLGLLRTVGPVYQFRHADLQNHLAGHKPRSAEQLTAKPTIGYGYRQVPNDTG